MYLVSIVCLVYNQEKYIEQALSSFIEQKTNFDFEIVVFDDASTDATMTIVNKYKETYPNRIRIIAQKKNQYSQHGLTHNYKLAIDTCTSKYIAYCEGDDYYIDPYKLQKQVDFMEANPDYNLVHTGYKRYKDYKKRFSKFDCTTRTIPTGDVLHELILFNHIIAPTTLFKTEIAKEALSKLTPISKKENWKTTDYPLWMYLAMHGKFGYIKDITTVYRLTKSSLSNRKNKKVYVDFLCSIHDIKLFFINYANINKQKAEYVIADSIAAIFRLSVKFNSPKKKYYRTLYLQNRHINKNWKLDFYAKYPIFDWIYRR